MNRSEYIIDVQNVNRHLHNLHLLTSMPATFLDTAYQRISDQILYDPSFDPLATIENQDFAVNDLPAIDVSAAYILQSEDGQLFIRASLIDNGKTLGYLLLSSHANPFSMRQSIFREKKLRTEDSESEEEALGQIASLVAEHLIRKGYVKYSSTPLTLISQYIQEHIHEDISADILQSIFLIPRNNIYQIIKDSFGVSLGHYILVLRLEHAKELLVKSNQSIMEIADLVGITDFNYFARIFRKHIGVSPSQYRKENRLIERKNSARKPIQSEF